MSGELRQPLADLSSDEKRALLASLLRARAREEQTRSPLSHGQRALWLLHRRAPENAAYNTAFAVRVRSAVDSDALRAALQTLTDRHAALRTTFETVEGRPVALIHGYREAAFDAVDASGWSESELARRIVEDYRRPFDPERGPLMRTTLYSQRADSHVLMLAYHHIVCDAWSMWLLMHELSLAYPAALAGKPADLPPVTAQYPDFVRWQERYLASPEGERQWTYWRERLAGELPVLDLACDRPRPPVQGLRGASHGFRIDGARVERLLEVGKAQGATLYMSLLAVFLVLLHRYSGQEDIVVGSPVAGRSHPDMASAVGYFANPLPVRASFSGNPSFREFLSQIRHRVLEALVHQDMPFPLLVERLKPRRDPSRWPLVEALFVLQRPPHSQQLQNLLAGETGGAIRWGGLDLEPFPLDQMEGQLDLTLEAVEGRGSLACTLKYNPDLFLPETVRRMEGHLRTLIDSATEDPERPVGELPMLTAQERRSILETWQETAVDYPLERCLHHWIQDQAARTPEAVAVRMAEPESGELRYGELDVRANRVARHLQSLGVGSDSVVAVLAERSLDLPVALLGILKAGAAYLPLDPDYPRQRLAFMVEDAGAAVLLTQAHLAERLPQLACPTVRLDADWPEVARHDADPPSSPVGPDHLAYAIYTSGSTGQPKGAENTHRAICNRLLWMQDEYRLQAGELVLQKTPIGFDVSVWELFWPLMTGATLAMARPGGHRERDYLVDTIVGQGIGTVHFVPSMLQVFLDAPGVERCRGTLKRVICSGEALPGELERRFFERLGVPLYNLYGPTEAAVDVTHWRCSGDTGPGVVPIGRPIANIRIRILDRYGQPVPAGVPGELYIGGVGLARGYRNRAQLTAERFVADPYGRPGERLYRTGDLCRWRPDGNIEYLERCDFQVKLRGFRVELGEIEIALRAHPLVRDAVVALRADRLGDPRLVAYPVLTEDAARPAAPGSSELAAFLRERLPEYMIPSVFVPIDVLPLGPNGKVDRAALPAPSLAGGEDKDGAAPRSETERRIADIWGDVLGHPQPGVHDNFFDLGGHSLLLAEVQTRLAEAFGRAPSMLEMLQLPSIRALAGFYAQTQPAPAPAPVTAAAAAGAGDIAIVGLAGRFPGAPDVQTLWRNLCDGVESIARFDDDTLRAAGVPEEQLRDPDYVKAFGVLDGIESFDSGYFGMTPREAQLTDVQHRLLLECATTALEDAGYGALPEECRCGLFAGIGMNRYLLFNLLAHPGLAEGADAYALMLGNDKDYAPTRVAYKLNLRGPALAVQSACSTSLVAVHMAARSLRSGECDLALAGGCSVTLPQDRGYLYREGMILSPDGRCRPFDVDAQGTVGGSGVALTVLKRLDRALADGDSIYAVVKGTAVSNDGAVKAGYTAPAVAGQAAAIASAWAAAGVEPDDIGLIEAHGTGTPLGDPIEVAALSQAFRTGTSRSGFCALGSVKSNLGHLDTAAGVTGLIKAVLAVKHALVPPSLHFREPNPALGLERTPFFVPTATIPWPAGKGPRRAGVSSFGIGGTNAHAVVEEPPHAPSGPGRAWQLLLLSAQGAAPLDDAARQLAERLGREPAPDLADAAFTLAVGRRALGTRRALACRTGDEAAQALLGGRRSLPAGVHTAAGEAGSPALAFLFPGQGSQYAGMAVGLYRAEPAMREEVDRCAALLEPRLGLDIRALLFPTAEGTADADARLTATGLAQPALFVVEYALSRLWIAWGIRPDALLGHSLGEYVAACLAGVWSLDDTLALVAARGALMQAQPGGAMLAVALPEEEVRACLGAELDLAAVNGPGRCTVSGPRSAVADLAGRLEVRGVVCQPLRTSHAFHSAAMEPALSPFRAELRKVSFHPPTTAFVSNLTGTWIEPSEATDPEYWVSHLRHTVRFSDGLATLLEEPGRCLLEVGPGSTLATLALGHTQRSPGQPVLSSLGRASAGEDDLAQILASLGGLWVAGIAPDWTAFYAGQGRRRVHLPTYPFQRQRCWIDPPESGRRAAVESPGSELELERKADLAEWLYVPSWQRTPPPGREPVPGSRWLVLMNEDGIGADLVRRLQRFDVRVGKVLAGERFERLTEDEYRIRISTPGDYDLLLDALYRPGERPDAVLYLWSLSAAPLDAGAVRARSFHALVALARALGERDASATCRLTVACDAVQQIVGNERAEPMKALSLGPVTVIPQEYERLGCLAVDLDLHEGWRDRQLDWLIADAAAGTWSERIVAYRGPHRWTQGFAPVRLPARMPLVRPGGVYLIAGGSGALGLTLAEWLARAAPGVHLALLSRSGTAAPASAPTLAPALERDRAQVRLEQLDTLCFLHIAEFFREQGFDLRPGQRYAREAIRSRLNVVPKLDRLLSFLLRVLAEEGIWTEERGIFVVRRALPSLEEIAASVREICTRLPELTAIDGFLAHCARHYGAALCGEIEAIGVLYPQGRLDLGDVGRQLTELLSQRNRCIEHCADLTLRAALDARRRDLPFRILEVGGGSGELTHALMQRLHGLGVEYCFTDIGRTVVRNAECRAAELGLEGIRFAVLDIAMAPAAQGFDDSGFDWIVALDVVHATPRVAETLTHLRGLLSPEGRLCLLETVKPRRYLDMIWGLAEGWWYFEDYPLREHSPLLGIPAWTDTLRQCGFAGIDVWPAQRDERDSFDLAAIVAAVDAWPSIDLACGESPAVQCGALRKLEALGAEVLSLKADVSDAADLDRALAEVRERLGPPNGVIHAAGIAGGGTIGGKREEDSERELAAKVAGSLSLASCLADTPLDFFVLCSSLTSVLGGLGQVAYCAASAYQDALAERLAIGGRWERVVSIDWDRWRNLGMAVAVEARHRELTGEALGGGMSAEQGVEAFGRILAAAAIPRILVSSRDLWALVELSRAWHGGRIEAQTGARLALHPRPTLANAYEPPVGETESLIAGIWQEELGLAQVGRHDDLFALGGDSLLAIRLASRLHAALGCPVNARAFYDAPTVCALAEYAASARWVARDGMDSITDHDEDGVL